MAFAGFVYCSLYLAAWLRIGRKDRAVGNWEGVWKLVVVLAPTAIAMFIGLTRIRDYWHHWEDVIVGAALGTGFAVLAWIHKKPYLVTSSSRGTSLDYSPLTEEEGVSA
jgi:membrane-associated phospholipid phosphatase